MTKRRRDPNWRDPRQAELDWYDGVIVALRRLIAELGGPMPESMLPRIPWEPAAASLPESFTPHGCTQRALQLDWVEAKVAS